jgi:hypothetical protein
MHKRWMYWCVLIDGLCGCCRNTVNVCKKSAVTEHAYGSYRKKGSVGDLSARCTICASFFLACRPAHVVYLK